MLLYIQMLETSEEKSKFEQLYLGYRNLMFYVANGILHNRQDSEDVVHESFLKIIKIIDKIENPNSIVISAEFGRAEVSWVGICVQFCHSPAIFHGNGVAHLGRFTFDTILDFEGLSRVLTILARGFLFHNENGSPAKAPRERIDYAKRGLCAWCSVPDSKTTTPREAWQFGSDFRKLHSEFPGLVDENSSG